MPHLGTLRDYRFATQAEDIRGSNLYGPEREKLGTIDDVIFDHSTGDIRYVVVDTGGWLSSKKFLVPGASIRPSAEQKDSFAIPLTKEQIERFPAYDENLLSRSEQWAEYEQEYAKAWKEAPVLHKEGSDRTITPAPEEMPIAPSGGGSSQAEYRPNLKKEGGVVGRYEPRVPSTMPPLAGERHDIGTSELRSPAGTPVSEASAKTTRAIRQRWQEFENSLRNNREELLSRCSVCSPKSERDREVA